MAISGLLQGDPCCLPTQNWLKTSLMTFQFRNITITLFAQFVYIEGKKGAKFFKKGQIQQ